MIYYSQLIGYIINLEDRVDRRTHVLNEITKLDLVSFQIVDAVVDQTKTCFKSHLKCINIAKEARLPCVLILEDDVTFTDRVREVLQQAFNSLETLEWDMLYLGANLQGYAQPVGTNLLKLSNAFTTHAYVVNSRMYDTILNLPHDREIDVHYSNLMSSKHVYMCDPIVAYQLPSYSDLQGGFRDYNQAIYENYKRYKL